MIAARSDPDVTEALRHFRATDAAAQSIYPFSPVFPALVDGHRVVIKRARQSVPDVVAGWTNGLAASGFACVAPVRLSVANPALLESGAVWVAYPWVAGRAYRPSVTDAAAAGDLLGRLHDRPLGAEPVPALPWPEYGPGEVAVDLHSYQTVAREHLTTSAAERLRDLSLAALQFHSEVLDRAFSAAEWTAFRDAYLDRVRLTDRERALWPVALDYQLWEEVAWAIGDDEWTDPRRSGYFTDVLAVTAERFAL